jgi:hypothetical protein
MILERAQEQFLAVRWDDLTLQGAKQQAKDLMDKMVLPKEGQRV